ncbi:hypothetical protein BDN72DRAFT_770189 [Pluteus cervinus]|uniref:Uncharacterized protein n=1 Tax=Pluteus cervinus TaxID=181527 RepID=A0ACD3AQ52_9AGAR|nr:hypothetical protein BDN72DRAFT_770189 [Pluteus cervinus]
MLYQVQQKLPALSYLESHGEAFNRTDKDTGKWLFNTKKFQDWSNGKPEVKGILVLGDPGVGKTCLVSLVIDHLQRTHGPSWVTYLYLHHQEAEAQTPAKIVSSLLQQILSNYSTLPDIAIGLYDHLEQGPPQMEVLVATLLNLLKDKQTAFFLVLDALDECKESYQPKLITLLKQMLTAKVQLLVTCRPTSADIKDLFDMPSCITQQMRATADDIQTFLAKKLESKKSLKSIINGQFQQNAIETIESKAQGV